MKSCNSPLFLIRHRDYTAQLNKDTSHKDYSYILTISHTNTGEIKYLKRYQICPNIGAAFENAYSVIDDNYIGGDKVECSKTCSDFK